MSFRLSTIFWAFAVVAAAMATFGIGGILCAATVLAIWAYVFELSESRARSIRLLTVVIALCVLLLLIALLLPAISHATEAARCNQCMSQIKIVALALQEYCETHESFPPSYVTDVSGTPALSWRALLLPYVDEAALHNRIDRSMAWNGPVNRQMCTTNVLAYECPSSQSTSATTDYLAVVGPHAILDKSRGRRIDEITDGPGNTIALTEARGMKVNWAESLDLSIDEAVELLASPPHSGDGHWIDVSFFHRPYFRRNIAFADGRGLALEVPLDRTLAKALLTIDGGEDVKNEIAKLKGLQWNPPLDYAAIYSLATLAILSLLPLTKVFRGTKSRLQGEMA